MSTNCCFHIGCLLARSLCYSGLWFKSNGVLTSGYLVYTQINIDMCATIPERWGSNISRVESTSVKSGHNWVENIEAHMGIDVFYIDSLMNKNYGGT